MVRNVDRISQEENTQNILLVSASAFGVMLLIIVLMMAGKVATDNRRLQQLTDSVSRRNNERFDDVYQSVWGKEMIETQLSTAENGQSSEPQTRVSGTNENGKCVH